MHSRFFPRHSPPFAPSIVLSSFLVFRAFSSPLFFHLSISLTLPSRNAFALSPSPSLPRVWSFSPNYSPFLLLRNVASLLFLSLLLSHLLFLFLSLCSLLLSPISPSRTCASLSRSRSLNGGGFSHTPRELSISHASHHHSHISTRCELAVRRRLLNGSDGFTAPGPGAAAGVTFPSTEINVRRAYVAVVTGARGDLCMRACHACVILLHRVYVRARLAYSRPTRLHPRDRSRSPRSPHHV